VIVHDLSGAAWRVRAIGDRAVPSIVRDAEFPARVPGCVHMDLIRAGVIPDPRLGFSEREQMWVGETDWEYRGTFRVAPELMAHERIDLVCDGLDTIAEVSVNGRAVGTAANMFHPHRFDVKGAPREPGTENEIVIVFRSPLAHVRAEQERLGRRPFNGDGLGWTPFNFIRKTASNFGWDWGPRVATCGVSGAMRVEGWNAARLSTVRPLVRRDRTDDRVWSVEVCCDLEWAPGAAQCATLTASLRGFDEPPAHLSRRSLVEGRRLSQAVHPGSSSAVLVLTIDQPRLWWPRNAGAQPLYTLEVSLGNQRWTREVAFREVCLNTDHDEHGEKFQLKVNGKPVFCKGANWIPEGLFPEDRTPQKIRERVRQAADANMNMLRVWGGGAYECDAFYEECDRLGITVWQDFMSACACYPEEAPYPALVEAEARHQIARLSAHPSVVLWCGGNECVWGYESWGHAPTDTEGPWKQRVGNKTWGAGYWFDLLPRLVRELDPTRPYWANSPFSGKRGENPNQEARGDRHTWDASPGSAEFRKIVPRFCAEFGQQGPPSLELLRKVIAPEGLVVGSKELEHRQRGTGGMAAHIDKHLEGMPSAKSFEEWHRMLQEAQAAALKAGIEWLAANRPRCMGALIWQLNDAWPGFSWSLIDSEGKPKPAYFAVREAFGKIEG
jgi:beta-mannosidase